MYNIRMIVDPLAEQARAVIFIRLKKGVRASPVCRAVMGWLSETRVDPFVAEIRRSSDGQVLLRLSCEVTVEPLCTFLEFLDQVRVICESLNMSDEQTRHMVAWARERLG